MKKKIAKVTVFIILIVCLSAGLYVVEKKTIPVIGCFIGVVLGILIPYLGKLLIDLSDVDLWQVELRQLRRAGILKKNDKVRISFAYLFRIKVDDKYMLVLNGRGTQKYQPVGGAYKCSEEEKDYLCNKFSVVDDDKIKLDKSSHNDYRLHVPVKYLKKFIKRFNKSSNRETISDLSREFKEELIETNILDFSHIMYRYCGRHFTKIEYSRHFNCYELLMADIVELKETKEQMQILRDLGTCKSKNFRFVNAKQIKTCGIVEGTDKMVENIGDHTIKILQDNEIELYKVKRNNKIYEVDIK
ncbi:MAG: hypothetical protein PHY47_15635 [Lachnospiraceae bacterium]|nr:hypothetical protein [Lachnospiraceae bacterium]